MIIGIIGLPQSGKTTLFNALCGTHQETGGYTAKGEVHRGVVKVPDPRIDVLVEIYSPKKITHAEIEWMDVAGFTGDVSDRNKLDTEIPNAIRQADAIAHVVRAFEDANLPHVKGSIDPERDIRLIEEELIISDLVTVEKRLERLDKLLRVTPDDSMKREKAIIDRCYEQLSSNKPLRDLNLPPEDEKTIRCFQFLSIKPMLLVLNISEADMPKRAAILQDFSQHTKPNACAVEAVSAKVEMELAELGEEDRAIFMNELGVTQSALDRVIRSSYDLMGLISYLTGGEKEVHAWTIKRGMTAPKAAAVIHKDFETGFIKAEVIPYEKLAQVMSESEAKKHGWMRLEGKEYIVQDGDVIFFRFNL